MDRELDCRPCLCVEAQFAQKMRHIIESQGILDDRFRLTKLSKDDNEIGIPIQDGMFECIQQQVQETGMFCSVPCRFTKAQLPKSKKMTIVTPRQKLAHNLKVLIEGAGMMWTQDLEGDTPRQWEIHGDLVLLPDSSFKHAIWNEIEPQSLWETVARSVNVSRVAKKGVVHNNNFRSPQVLLLLGDTGWVEQIDNGIRFTYDIQHCMFSSGNITEKLRVASFNCEGETVVDLYAGIGYFTMPYLVHAKAAMVHACEWNPHAVRALEKNLHLNNVREKCVIHAGDNSMVCPKGIADRVNLGLIPSSQKGWPIACAALKSHSGGILHIHGNVTTAPVKPMEDAMSQGSNADKQVTADRDGTNCGADRDQVLKRFRGPAASVDSTTEEDAVGQSNDCTNAEKYGDLCVAENVNRTNLPVQDYLNKRYLKDCSKDDFHTVQGHDPPKVKSDENFPDSSKAAEGNVISFLSSTHNASKGGTRTQWNHWASDVAKVIQSTLRDVHDGKDWNVHVIHVEHVKSYAPHVDHIVADLECRPKS